MLKCVIRARTLALSAAATAFIFSGPLEADVWNTYRHDSRATGTSRGQLPDRDLEVRFRVPTGGSVPATQYAVLNVAEQTMVAPLGGRVRAIHAVTQSPLWASEPLGAISTIDVGDLDGNNTLEVVVGLSSGVVVLNGQTGHILWNSPTSDHEIIARTSVADLNGDGLMDIYVDDHSSSASPSPNANSVYFFSDGFDDVSSTWQRQVETAPRPANAGTDALLSLSDGTPAVFYSGSSVGLVLDGATGEELYRFSLALQVEHPLAMVAELDEDTATTELIIVQQTSRVGGDTRAGVDAYRLNEDGSVDTLWSRRSDDVSTVVSANASMVSDLDGDGAPEVAWSWVTGTARELLAVAGTTGEQFALIADTHLEGALDLDGDGASELITADSTGLNVYRSIDGDVEPVGAPIPNVRAILTPSKNTATQGLPIDHAPAVFLSGGDAKLLVGSHLGPGAYEDFSRATSFGSVISLELETDGLKETSSFVPEQGQLTGARFVGELSRAYNQFAMVDTETRLLVFDSELHVTNGAVQVGDTPRGALLGAAADVTSGQNLIVSTEGQPLLVITDSSGGTRAVDVSEAGLFSPGETAWHAPQFQTPSFFSLPAPYGDVTAGTEGHQLVLRSALDGEKLDSAQISEGRVYARNRPHLIQVEGREPLVGVARWIEGRQMTQHAVDFFGDGGWQGEPEFWSGAYMTTVFDIDDDGTDEWLSVTPSGISVRDALDGEQTLEPAALSYAFVSRLSKETPLALFGSASGPQVRDENLDVLWSNPRDPARPYNAQAGALVTCEDGEERLVTAAWTGTTVRTYSLDTGEPASEVFLCDGAATPVVQGTDLPDLQIGCSRLSAASAILDGHRGETSVFLGATDGFLYQLDACSLELKNAIFLESSVSEAAIGDFDSDGDDEIIVGVSDGNVYGLDEPPPISFGPVTATTSQGEAVCLASRDQSVEFTWPAVDGATYEVSLIGPDEQALWDPPIREVSRTSYVISTEGFLAERALRLAVRAVVDGERSAQDLSPPFVVTDAAPPTIAVAEFKVETAELELVFNATDDVSLDAFWVVLDDIVLDEGLLTGEEASVEVLANLQGQEFTDDAHVEVHVLDSAQNRSIAKLELASGEEGGDFQSQTTSSRSNALLSATLCPDDEDSGSTDTRGLKDFRHAEDVGSCACRTSPFHPSKGNWPFLLMGPLFLALFLRRHSRAGRIVVR